MKRLMKPKRTLFVLSVVLLAGLIGGGIGFAADRNIALGTGGMSGTYYPLGVAMAKMWSASGIGVNVGAEATGGSIENILIMIASTGFSVVAYSAVFGNFLYRKCRAWERLGLLVSGILLITPGFLTDLSGFLILVAIYLWQRQTKDAVSDALA